MMGQDNVIVCIEDNLAHARLIGRHLLHCRPELHVVHLAGGEEAMQFLAESSLTTTVPKLILLDLRLPKIDGFEVLRQLKSSPVLNKVPVIVLSTSHSASDVRAAYRCGANSYLVKPLEFAAFQEMIDSLCHYWFDWNVEPA